MTREAFIEVLKREDCSYKIEGDKIVVTDEWDVYLFSLPSLPPDVEFRNRGFVSLDRLTSLPPGVVFKNRGHVHLESLTSLPSGVVFKNRGRVDLESLTSLPPGVVFRNRGFVNLRALIGGRFDKWKGNIEGIDSKRLLNSMISKGLFER
jgi:hypothetical protein